MSESMVILVITPYIIKVRLYGTAIAPSIRITFLFLIYIINKPYSIDK